MTKEALKNRYEGSQSFLQEACLFLSLTSIAEQVTNSNIDILGTLAYCKRQGYINSKNEMTVEGQCAYLRDLTGKNWRREVLKELPNPVPDEMYTIEKWKRDERTHFRRRFMDTLTNSQTVALGKLVEYYCYIHDQEVLPYMEELKLQNFKELEDE